MTKLNIFKWTLIASVLVITGACSKDDDVDTGVSVITVDEESNDFDKYIEKVFTEPYNIDILYKMKDVESDMDYQLVPAIYENSIKMANLVKYLCLDSYEEVAPDNFLKLYFPKMLMMVGSPAYQNNGTMIIGTAEGGLKITLYNINQLDVMLNLEDEAQRIEVLNTYYFRTIFHEFSHILHQTKDYTTDFDKISSTNYVGDSWSDAWGTGESLQAGFISDYSSKEANEDFVELIAHYVTYTADEWDAAMEDAGEDGSAILEEKMTIVSNYLLQTWDIDIDALRSAFQTREDAMDEQDFDNITIGE